MPAVTVRCGRGERQCDRIAQIYETPGGAVVVFHQHLTDRPAEFEGELPTGYEWEADGFKVLDLEESRGLLRGHRDTRGTVVCLEDDTWWSDIVEAGCSRHVGFVHLTRAYLMDELRKARRLKRPRIVQVVPAH